MRAATCSSAAAAQAVIGQAGVEIFNPPPLAARFSLKSEISLVAVAWFVVCEGNVIVIPAL